MEDEDIAHGSTAQVLVTHLTDMELGPEQIAKSETAREQAEAFTASFLRQAGEPEDPERFNRVATLAINLVAEHQSSTRAYSSDDGWEDYLRLRNGLATLFTEEAILPYRE